MQESAQSVQSLAPHASPFGTSATKEGATRAKMGVSRDIFWNECCKREHDPCTHGYVTRHLLLHVLQKGARLVQTWVRHATSFATTAAKDVMARATFRNALSPLAINRAIDVSILRLMDPARNTSSKT